MIPNIRSTYISVFCQYRYLMEHIKLTHLFVLYLFGNWHVPLLFVPNLSINVASHKSDPLFDIEKEFLWDKILVNSQHCAAGYDMYDFSEVTSDLAILRSQLFTLNVGEKPKPNNHVTATWDPQWDTFTHF